MMNRRRAFRLTLPMLSDCGNSGLMVLILAIRVTKKKDSSNPVTLSGVGGQVANLHGAIGVLANVHPPRWA